MWMKGASLPFPKKGDLGSASKYRGITLMAMGGQIYNRMILDRLRPQIDPKLRNNQNGVGKGRSTVAQIFTRVFVLFIREDQFCLRQFCVSFL